MARPVLVLDFDGTVCLGDGPVLAHARHIEASDRAAAGLEATLEAFLRDPDHDATLLDAQDGYQAVALLCERLGIPPSVRDASYAASRDTLAGTAADVHAPPGLADLLADLDATVVLLTNAPAGGLDNLLGHLGLAEVIRDVRTEAGKPQRMGEHLDTLCREHGLTASPEFLLSVGDIWRNDLEAALARGCATAYVDSFGRRQGPAHVRARTLPELYPAIRQWASDPSAFVVRHPLQPSSDPSLVGADTTRPGAPE